MDFKKLNETLELFLEDSINEISFETKRSYLAKRKAQLDAAKKAFDKANRLIRNTEMSKKNDVVGEEETLKTILRKIKDAGATYNNKTFGYIESFKTWAYIQTGELDNDSNTKHCKITLAFYDGYLRVNIKTNNPWRQSEEIFNMAELTTTKLINKASAYILKVLKEKTKQFTKTQKISPKIQKTIEQIKNVLSRAKEDKLEGNEHQRSILIKLESNGRREKMPAVVSVTVNIPHVDGHEKDYEVKAIALDRTNLKIVLFAIVGNRGMDVYYLENSLDSFDSQDLYNALNIILEQLKGNVKGKSNLKGQQNKLEENKKLAEKAAEELRTHLKSIGGYGCEIERVKENGNSFEILTFDFGMWGDSKDWEEDNDFMRPTKETMEILEEVCKDFSQKYKTLKFSYGISEKRMLSFYVEYTI